MMDASVLKQSIVFLGSALVCVPIAKRLGIGSVLGYLFAGMLVGPYVLGFVGSEGEDIMHAAEFGVVMMLFVIGLELNPVTFWKMRKTIIGMGLSQVAITSLVLMIILFFVLDMNIEAALAISLSFSLSSTAIVLQTLKERGISKTQAGKSSFAVLLMQDIAVIPILAFLPLLALTETQKITNHEEEGINNTIVTICAFAFIVFASKFLINPLLKIIAKAKMQELFTASALFIVIGVSYLMHLAGISAALGAFMAGVLLANSQYRHELESDIEPFKGLLLGVFFIAVGSTINFHLIIENPITIITGVLFLMLVKALILASIGKIFKLKLDQNLLFALMLSQVGEFAFVILTLTKQLEIIDNSMQEMLMAITTISMTVSPLLLYLSEKFVSPYIRPDSINSKKEADDIHEDNPVIIAGFGHYGSTVGRFLRANGVEATILDNDPEQVDFLRKMGFKVYYGDATRLELLKSAGADNAKIIISALNSKESSAMLIKVVQKHFPNLKIFVRAKNRFDAYEFMDLGLTKTYRESLHSSVYMGADVLHELGFRNYTAYRKANEFIQFDENALSKLAKERHNIDNYIESAKEEIAIQEKLIKADNKFVGIENDNSWDSDKRKEN
jgi:CPA2 family monovalent cation:H+ antiporter-2